MSKVWNDWRQARAKKRAKAEKSSDEILSTCENTAAEGMYHVMKGE